MCFVQSRLNVQPLADVLVKRFNCGGEDVPPLYLQITNQMKKFIQKAWVYIKNYIVKKHIKEGAKATAQILTFNREKSGRWYIYLPNWSGPKAALEMVAGADTLLDSLCTEGDKVILYVDTERFSDAEGSLAYEAPHMYGDGAFYLTEPSELTKTSERVWLCGVTEFVFGAMPPEIFYKVITYNTGVGDCQ